MTERSPEVVWVLAPSVAPEVEALLAEAGQQGRFHLRDGGYWTRRVGGDRLPRAEFAARLAPGSVVALVGDVAEFPVPEGVEVHRIARTSWKLETWLEDSIVGQVLAKLVGPGRPASFLPTEEGVRGRPGKFWYYFVRAAWYFGCCRVPRAVVLAAAAEVAGWAYAGQLVGVFKGSFEDFRLEAIGRGLSMSPGEVADALFLPALSAVLRAPKVGPGLRDLRGSDLPRGVIAEAALRLGEAVVASEDTLRCHFIGRDHGDDCRWVGPRADISDGRCPECCRQGTLVDEPRSVLLGAGPGTVPGADAEEAFKQWGSQGDQECQK